MPSLIYNSFWEDVLRGLIDVDSVTVRVMLTTSAYTENKDTHPWRGQLGQCDAHGAQGGLLRCARRCCKCG